MEAARRPIGESTRKSEPMFSPMSALLGAVFDCSLDMSYAHATGVYSLPKAHGDPFDRLLISQCRTNSLIAVTNDAQWSDPDYGIRVIW